MSGLSRGWYQDSDDPELARWHDGHQMTEHSLVIADQPQGRTPDPPENQPAWLDDEEISWSPDALPLPEETLYAPRHRAHAPQTDAETFWDDGVPLLTRARWSKLAMPLGIVALVIAAAIGLQLRDDGGDDVGLTAADSVSPADGLASDNDINAMGARRPAVSVPMSAVTIPSTTTTAEPSTSTTPTTKKATGKTPAKPPATTTTTTTTMTTVPAPAETTTTTTAAATVTAGESCSPEGATAQTSSGDPLSCAPACGGGPNDLVWRVLDC